MNWAPNLDRIIPWWTLPILVTAGVVYYYLGLGYLIVVGISFFLGYVVGTFQTALRIWNYDE